jgi:hypothetical protein
MTQIKLKQIMQLLSILTVFLLFACLVSCNNISVPKPERSISYKIVDQWSITNGGLFKVIVIDSTMVNDSDIRDLGRQLWYDTQSDRNASIQIFDNMRAAGMRKDAIADRLNKTDLEFYDHHNIGTYNRNINTGNHELIVDLNPPNGPQVEITSWKRR